MDQGFREERFLAAYQTVQLCCTGSAEPLRQSFILADYVTSTNQRAWEWFGAQRTGEPLVIARSQTAGRGQWGRHWRSAPGGLYLSVGLRPNLPANQATQLTLCTAWGIATALREIPARLSGVDAGIPVQLKWPNDLVLQGYKLGGILTETQVQGEQIARAVVGVGINWTNPVPATGITLQQFLETHTPPLIESLELLAAIALWGILSGLQHLQTDGIDGILAQYFNLLAHRDRPVPLHGQLGKIIGVAPTGELRIRLEKAEIFLNNGFQSASPREILIKPGTISFGYPL